MIDLVEPTSSSSLRFRLGEVLSSALVLILAYLVRTRYHGGLNKIPGPFLASLTSLWKWNIVRQERMPFVNTELHERHGPLVRIGPNHVSASSAESIQVVHRSRTGFTKVCPRYHHEWKADSVVSSRAYMASYSLDTKVQTCTTSSQPRMPTTMPPSSVRWGPCTQRPPYLRSSIILTTVLGFLSPRCTR